jgi:hypothetical protein
MKIAEFIISSNPNKLYYKDKIINFRIHKIKITLINLNIFEFEVSKFHYSIVLFTKTFSNF